MTFANPWLLFALLLVPIAGYLLFSPRIKMFSGIRYPDVARVKSAMAATRSIPMLVSKIAKLVFLTILILALARPQMGYHSDEQEIAVRDLFIVLDCSQSMEALDLEPNRLEASKTIIHDFIAGRAEGGQLDRIGLVVFGMNAYLQCPLTTDYNILYEALKNIDFGFINGDATAIGDGIVTALNRLRHSQAESKVIILLTDGDNNSGAIDPYTAAELASAIGVRIYTIGIGKQGVVPMPVHTALGTLRTYGQSNFDEAPLRRIAATCNGKYFAAADSQTLANVFEEINKLETTIIQQEKYTWYREYFPLLIKIALWLLAGIFAIDLIVFRRIP